MRNRQFVVLEVVKSVLPAAPLRPAAAARNGSQHLVHLSSVEEDGLGEKLTAVWEIEGESAAIRRRFASPSPRLFPVAVTFLVARRLAGR